MQTLLTKNAISSTDNWRGWRS